MRLSARFVEKIHDELVALYFPGDEPVSGGDPRDRSALESALAAPFAIAFGAEAFPAFHQKVARMFYGIIADHPFSNGNKRTALVAADLFAYANGFFLGMGRRTSVWAARTAAKLRCRGTPAAPLLKNAKRGAITAVPRRQPVEVRHLDGVLGNWQPG